MAIPLFSAPSRPKLVVAQSGHDNEVQELRLWNLTGNVSHRRGGQYLHPALAWRYTPVGRSHWVREVPHLRQ